MCTSTLTNVLVALNTPTQLALSPNMMMDTLEVIKTQANIFQRFVFDRVHSQWMSAEEIRQVASVILTCLNAGLMCKDPGTENVPPDDFKLKLLNELRRVSRFTEETIELTKKAVSYVQTSGQPPSKVASSGDKMVMWAMCEMARPRRPWTSMNIHGHCGLQCEKALRELATRRQT
ncbi:hypothetical protein J6590_058700 [Homalodisca vitripennis]|nr:hypothetical protein J6590_058700 [Homalodisca vitripennis]